LQNDAKASVELILLVVVLLRFSQQAAELLEQTRGIVSQHNTRLFVESQCRGSRVTIGMLTPDKDLHYWQCYRTIDNG